MDDVLVIGAGPSGLMAAILAAKQGAKVRVLAAGIGTTHISPGWIGVLNTDGDLEAALKLWISDHPDHPYALAGLDALVAGLQALDEICAPSGLKYVGSISSNFRLPTALGAVKRAALVPESFAAGDLRQHGAILIAGPRDWRDFYPMLCAENLRKRGIQADGVHFDLPGTKGGYSDQSAPKLALLFDEPEVRREIAVQLKPRLEGARRVGLPAVIGLEHSQEAWRDLQDLLGVPVFEIPTLTPSVPGMRMYSAFKKALSSAGVQVQLDTTVSRGIKDDKRAKAVAVRSLVRETLYDAGRVILATGGLYGGGLVADCHEHLQEQVFDLPVDVDPEMPQWFGDRFLSPQPHPIHYAGVRANKWLQPLDHEGRIAIENVRVTGRLLAGYSPLTEGSTEGVCLATAYRAIYGE